MNNQVYTPPLAGDTGFHTDQIDVGVSAVLIAPDRPGRSVATVINLGTTKVWIGDANVSPDNGVPLLGIEGASIDVATSADVFAVTSDGMQRVAVLETF